MELTELNDLIKPLLDEKTAEFIPESERANYKNFKIFPIGILKKANWNYKLDDELIAEKLNNNINRIGQVENIQVRKLDDGYYEIVNGNHRYDELLKLQRKFVVAYDHGDISLSEAKRIATETNETHFEADPDKLSLLLNEISLEFEIDDLKMTLPYSDREFQNMMKQSFRANSLDVDGIEEVESEEAPERPVSVRGDLYELGPHRLLCGDSTKSEDVDRLMNGELAHMMHTDPPYNINYAELNKKRRGGKGKDWTEDYCSEWEDSMSDSDYRDFLYNFIQNAKDHLIEYAHYYIWYASEYYPMLTEVLKELGIAYDKAPLVWMKQVAPITYARYARLYEPCIFAGKDCVVGNSLDASARWFGPTNEKNIWQINREANQYYVHPTQKPLELCGRAVRNSSKVGEIVLDLFGGSGSTMIAADQIGRIARLMEYEPKFVDVIVKRYFKYCEQAGKEAIVKLNGEIITIDYFDQEVNNDNL